MHRHAAERAQWDQREQDAPHRVAQICDPVCVPASESAGELGGEACRQADPDRGVDLLERDVERDRSEGVGVVEEPGVDQVHHAERLS